MRNKVGLPKHTGGRQGEVEKRMKRYFGVLKSNPKSVQLNRAIGLHKEVMSLYIQHMLRHDDTQQMCLSSTGQRFFSSVPDGVFNNLSSFTCLEELGGSTALLIHSSLANRNEGELCPSRYTTQSRYSVPSRPLRPCAGRSLWET